MRNLILIAALLGSAASTAANADVINGGFETGDFTGWTFQYNDGTAAVDSASAASGVYSALLGGGGQTVLTQTVATTAGTKYRVSFSLAATDAEVFLAGPSALPLRQVFGTPGFDFRPYAYRFTANGTSETLRFQAIAPDGAWRLDDVSITAAAVPEPGTWLLAIVGFGLAAGAMRGRRMSGVSVTQ